MATFTDVLQLLDTGEGILVTNASGDIIQINSLYELLEGLKVGGAIQQVGGEQVNLSALTPLVNYTEDQAGGDTPGVAFVISAEATEYLVSGAFVAGIAATSNPTVQTGVASGLAAGDIIQISDPARPENAGLYEVQTHAANVLTVRGIGTTARSQSFVNEQFTADATVQGSVRKVTVSVIRARVDGQFEIGNGNTTTGWTFATIATGSGDTLVLTAGEDLVAGNPVYIADDGLVYKAAATGASGSGLEAEVVGVVKDPATTGNPVTLYTLHGSLVFCKFDVAPGTGDRGKRVNVSATAGDVTLTVPSGSGQSVSRVGILQDHTASLVLFMPSFVSRKR